MSPYYLSCARHDSSSTVTRLAHRSLGTFLSGIRSNERRSSSWRASLSGTELSHAGDITSSMPDCRQSLLSAGLVLTDDDGIDRLLAVPQALTPDIHIDRHVLSTHGKQCGKHASATPARVTTPYRGVSSHNEAGDLCLSPSTSTGSRCARRASSPPFMPSPVLPSPRSSLLSATVPPCLNVSDYRRARSVCTCI